jgi:glutathione synthase/RimK-type ligase-like ATP-grasp enzyme
MKIAVLRCNEFPKFVQGMELPPEEETFGDDFALVERLNDLGADAESVPWGADLDWRVYDAAILRSTWDYIDDPARFIETLSRIENACRLFNPLETIRWNMDKSYLIGLQRKGVPVVPTVPIDDWNERLASDWQDRGWREAILKPNIGAGGFGLNKIQIEGVARAKQSAPNRSIVQPMIFSIQQEGEWGFTFIEGEFTHALLKKPASGDYRVHEIYNGTIQAKAPSPEDLAEASQILAMLDLDPLYVRLDLVRMEDRLVVMELELIEPMLYFHLAPHAAQALASATMSRLEASQ